MSRTPELSIVVPLFEEAANVGPLVQEIRAALDGDYRWELILVDDGSTDATSERARAASRSDPRIRFLALARNYGQSVAMRAGFDAARAPLVVSMDGDLQNDPADIPRLVRKLEEGYDLIAGWRKERWEGKFLRRKLPSVIANRLIRWITGTSLRDTGCSLKAYRSSVLENLPLYAELHRYLAPVALATSGARIAQVPVRSRPRRHGESKYGGGRVWRVLVDLLTLMMIRRFRDRPMMMFGIPAVLLVTAGTGLAAAAALVWLTSPSPVLRESYVFAATALLTFGSALFLMILGFVAESVVRSEAESGGGLVPLASLRSCDE